MFVGSWTQVRGTCAPTPQNFCRTRRWRLPDRTGRWDDPDMSGSPWPPQGPNGGRKNFGASNCSSALLHSVAHSCPNLVTERPRDPCGPPPRPQAPPPQVHETTICPFDHYSDGKTTGPLRTAPTPWSTKPLFVHLTIIVTGDHGTLADHRPDPRPHPPRSTKPLFVHLTIIVTERPRDPCGPAPHPPWSTKPLFVHLTIIVTERPRDPCGPPPDPRPHPQDHETTICPFDHYSDGKTPGPLRTIPSHPPRSTKPLFVHLTIIVTERPRDPCGPPTRPHAPPPQVHETTICPFDHYSDGKTPGPLWTSPHPQKLVETEETETRRTGSTHLSG
ncbi:hypothetical protein G5714_000815 [Onychostoma macrolepis]|uniref:Uncharacterized protein n=1 Tax=Onychostoma macrolepis TaxID=369639 RepID=A0A7J6DIX5_9TELE|nr:hypothetical protein G5714_000815 [Onychostoma macrolepis]